MVLVRRSSIAVVLLLLVALATGVGMTPAVAVSGSAWAWGFNGADLGVGGALGDGTSTDRGTPVAVSMPAGVTLSAIAAGAADSLALDSSGQAWAWGADESGQLGDGTIGTGRTTPVPVSMPAGITFSAIAAGEDHSVALDSNGQAWAWGNNSVGQIGDRTSGHVRLTPVAVSMPAGVSFTAIAAGASHSVALDSSGHAWAWGNNDAGQLGVGGFCGQDVDEATRPLCVTAPVAVSMPAGVSFSAISAGFFFNLALDSSGQAWGWGAQESGQLGDGTTTMRTAPVAVSMPAGVSFSAIAAGSQHSLALDSNGQAWAWGDNSYGQLGDGTNLPRSTPLPVNMPAGVSFSAIAAGETHSVALDNSGHAWAWGANGHGQVGDGTYMGPGNGNYQLTPAAVSMPAGVRFSAISAGMEHSLALGSK